MAEDLISLIRSGRLAVGTTVVHGSRGGSANAATATVVQEGLRLRGRVYSTPSGAARAITGKPVDGWIFWRLPGGETLDSLRSGRRRQV